jgi:ribonucleoside-diphosphate reductase alpha chain
MVMTIKEFEKWLDKMDNLLEEANKKDVIDPTLRADRQGREVGVEIGDICPICKEGTVIESGGCNTCTNCGAQLKCGL